MNELKREEDNKEVANAWACRDHVNGATAAATPTTTTTTTTATTTTTTATTTRAVESNDLEARGARVCEKLCRRVCSQLQRLDILCMTWLVLLSYTINLYLAHNHRTWSNHHKREIGTFDLWKGSSLIWDLINRICSLFRNTHWFIILVLKSNLLKTVQPSGIILLQNELIGLGRVLPNKAENRVNLRLRHHPRWDWKK